MSNPANDLPFIIKVCGVTTLQDAQIAIDAGANAIGFNFYAQSPRFITPEAAAAIIAKLRSDALRVGIFVNPTDAIIRETSPFLDVIQVHGELESKTAAGLPVWRAITAGMAPDPSVTPQAWLLDSFTPAFGGSGKTFDWSLASRFPYRAIVAGGLDESNVTDAIRIAQPWGVDACSRLESSPGRKDPRRVATFVERALQSFQALQAVNL